MTPELLELEAVTPGWLHPGEGETLAKWATGRLCVEIGSYCGKSTLWVASTAQHVISIDPHRGNPEMAPGHDCHHPEVWDHETQTIDSAPGLRRTLWKAQLDPYVTVICQDANIVAPWIDAPIGFVFVDGNHAGDGPLNDYRSWGPKTDIIAFHDSDIGFVKTAWEAAQADGFTLAEHVQSLRVFTR